MVTLLWSLFIIIGIVVCFTNGRMDSLGIDENYCPVIFEYNLISQKIIHMSYRMCSKTRINTGFFCISLYKIVYKMYNIIIIIIHCFVRRNTCHHTFM